MSYCVYKIIFILRIGFFFAINISQVRMLKSIQQRSFFIPPPSQMRIAGRSDNSFNQLEPYPSEVPNPTNFSSTVFYSPQPFNTFLPYGFIVSASEEDPVNISARQQTFTAPPENGNFPVAVRPQSPSGYGPALNNSFSNPGISRPPPTCPTPLYTAILPEQAPVGTFVLKPEAIGQGLQWAIADTAFERFTIDPNTGDIAVVGSLRRKTRAALEFKIRATDQFGLWCDAIVRINVIPDASITISPAIRNSPPYFVNSYYYFTLNCGQTGPQRVGSVLATDLDPNQSLTYQITGSNEFTIDASGNVQTLGTLQPSSSPQRTFTVVTVDSGVPAQTGSTIVTVTVTGNCGGTPSGLAPGTPPPSSNTPPSFAQASYTLTASCRVNGAFAGMVSATDYEGTPVTYSITGTQEFSINPSTGEVRVQGALNDANPRSFYVVATDSGTPALSARVPVTVTMVNCSPLNNPPTFGQSTYLFTIPCSSQPGTIIGVTQAFDTEGNQISYTIAGTQEFRVDAANGYLTLVAPLQTSGLRQFTVVVTDNGQPSMSTTTGISVVVTGNCGQEPVTAGTLPPPLPVTYPATQLPPVYTQPAYTQPPYPQPPATIPSYTQPSYYTQPTPYVPPVTAPPPTAPVPYYTQPPYTQAPPYQPKPATAPPAVYTYPPTLPATILTVPPPRPPVFPQPSYQFVAPCSVLNGSYTQIGSVRAEDSQGSSLTYLVISGAPGFDVGYSTGNIVSVAPIIDTGPRQIVVVAKNNGNPPTSATTTIQINVIGPCSIPGSFTTPQPYQPPPVYITPSPPYYPTPSPVPYTQPTYPPPVYTLPPPTQPTYTQPPYTPPPYTQPPYITPPVTPYPTTYIYAPPSTPAPPAYQPPKFIQNSYSFLMTCPLGVGQLVGVVQASGSVPVMMYFLTGTQDFTVSSVGEIRTSRPLTGPLAVSFQVIATDSQSRTATAQVQVSIPLCQTAPPQPPRFPQPTYTVNIVCPTSPNVLIGTITAQYSQPQLLVYNIPNTNQFTIDSFGEIRSSVLLTSGTYSFSVTATDQSNPSLAASVQVTVNVGPCATQPPPILYTQPTYPVTYPPTYPPPAQTYYTYPPQATSPPFRPTPAPPLVINQPLPNLPPYFSVSSYSFTVVCNSQPGTAIGSVYAFDDVSAVTYAIRSPSFTINPATGDIQTTTVIQSSSQMYFTVTASDSAGLSASANVEVSVTGCSQQPSQQIRQTQPIITGSTSNTVTNCDQSTSMVPPGAAVGTLSASSAFGNAGRLQYSANDRRFTVSPYTGQLFAGSTLDSGSYVFPVVVADLAAPQSITTASFTVVVDCASIGYRPCNPPYVETSVSESAPVGTLVLSLQNAGLGLSSSRPYSVPYNSGLPPGGTLNSIEFPSYSTSQNLQSYGGPYTSYRRSLRHTGEDEIESRRTKKYRQLSYASLNQMSPSAVGTNFLIQKTSGPGVFRVDPNSGQITIMQPLDRERTDSYMLKVRSSIGNQYCVTKVGIEITDINDNTPIFSNQSYVFTAPCDSASAFVGAVTARDVDSGLRGFVHYSITNPNNMFFGIDCFTGEIRLRRQISPNNLPAVLTIQAENPTAPSLSTTTAVTVNPGLNCFR